MKKTSVLVAILTGQERHFWIHPELLGACINMVGWQKRTGSSLSYTTVYSCTPVDAARNEAVMRMLRSDAEWLLQIDNDVVPSASILNALEEIGDRKIVGFPSFIEHDTGTAGLNLGKKVATNVDGDGEYMMLERLTPGWSEIDVVGSGCLLVHRDVFLKIADPWFECTRTAVLKHRNYRGEDFSFCAKARAIGFSIWTHSDFRCDHHRTINLMYLADAQRRARKDYWESLKRIGFNVPQWGDVLDDSHLKKGEK